MTPTQIRELIAQGDLEAALKAMVELAKGTRFEADMVALSARYAKLRQERSRSILSSDDEQRFENQLIQDTLSFLVVLEQELPQFDTPYAAQPGDPDSPADLPDSRSGSPSNQPGRGETPTESPRSYLFPSIAGLGLMIGIVLLLVFVPCPSSSQYAVFRIVLAMALAGFAAVIPGFLTFKYKQALSAGGALAVFALAYLVDPAASVSSDDCNLQPFTLTVFVEDAKGRSVLRGEGTLLLTLPDDKREETLDGDGKATFTQLPATLAGDSSRIELQAKGWQFTNGKPTQSLSLAQASQTLVVERDASLCCLSGSVRDADGFVPGARVSVKGDFVLTDSVGRFELELSEGNQREEVTVTIFKEGYGLWTGRAYPGSEREVGVKLDRQE